MCCNTAQESELRNAACAARFRQSPALQLNFKTHECRHIYRYCNVDHVELVLKYCKGEIICEMELFKQRQSIGFLDKNRTV